MAVILDKLLNTSFSNPYTRLTSSASWLPRTKKKESGQEYYILVRHIFCYSISIFIMIQLEVKRNISTWKEKFESKQDNYHLH